LDLRLFVPKLAVAALQVIEEMQEPALFQFVEVLVDFREGTLTAADLPQLVPKTAAAITELPAEIQSKAVDILRREAAKAAESQRTEEKLAQIKGVEVHCRVTCDGCKKSPIIGARYKSLEREDYDLCPDCYGHPERVPEQFARVKSSTFGDVVSSYYGPVAEHGRAVHVGVECDGCQMCPLVGRRFTKVGHDYDLCGACFEAKADQGDWQEVTITPDTHLVPLSKVAKEEAPVVDGVTPGCLGSPPSNAAGVDAVTDGADGLSAMLSTPGKAMAVLKVLPEVLDDEVCAELMTSLLSHSNESVRMAVHTALQRASGNSTVLAQEPCADVDETRAIEVVELQDSGLAPAPANSSSFDRLAFMLNQVPIEVPMQTPTQATEAIAEGNKDAHLVAPTEDMKTDVEESEDVGMETDVEESEDVGMEGPKQVADSTGHTPNASGTRTDAGEDWCLL